MVAYTYGMRITPESDDAPDFVRHVERVVNGIIRLLAPESVVLIKIDNFFGSKWLGLSGKALGAIGVWHNPSYDAANIVRLPPFVPNREKRTVPDSQDQNDNQHHCILCDVRLTKHRARTAPYLPFHLERVLTGL